MKLGPITFVYALVRTCPSTAAQAGWKRAVRALPTKEQESGRDFFCRCFSFRDGSGSVVKVSVGSAGEVLYTSFLVARRCCLNGLLCWSQLSEMCCGFSLVDNVPAGNLLPLQLSVSGPTIRMSLFVYRQVNLFRCLTLYPAALNC